LNNGVLYKNGTEKNIPKLSRLLMVSLAKLIIDN
jgi:hypothetical protein